MIKDRHIMLDLETLATDSNALILSVSAVEFEIETGKIVSEFYESLDILEQLLKKNTVVSIDTIKWWQEQDDKAKQFLSGKSASLPAWSFFEEFNKWIGDPANVYIWGNGAGFDCVILRNMYSRFDVRFPLPYYADMDVRTITHLVGYKTLQEAVGPFNGIKHYGIDDCKHQISMVVAGLKMIKNG